MPTEQKAVEIRLVDIEDLAFSFNKSRFYKYGEVPKGSYNINVKSHVDIDAEKSHISIFMMFDFIPKEENHPEKLDGKIIPMPSLRYEGVINYRVIGIDLESNSSSKDVSLPIDLVKEIGSISLSTFRGILFNKCKDTPLRNVIIPLISPDNVEKIMANSAS